MRMRASINSLLQINCNNQVYNGKQETLIIQAKIELATTITLQRQTTNTNNTSKQRFENTKILNCRLIINYEQQY